MRYYPIFLKVENQPCLVVGGGEVGARKVETLLRCRASVGVVSPEVVPWLEEKIQEELVQMVGTHYEEHQLQGRFLVIAATDDVELNCRIARDAEKRGTESGHGAPASPGSGEALRHGIRRLS